MVDKPSKVWEPYSKLVKMPEEDWAVQRSEFIKRFVAKGLTSYLYQLKSRTPEALLRIAQASTTLSSQGSR
jgi:hypothetical protein